MSYKKFAFEYKKCKITYYKITYYKNNILL